MDAIQLFLQRHGVIHDYYIEGMWEFVPGELMRQRPHPKVNSIAWILWHMTRGEDAGMNRFITDRSQVLDDGGWMERMNVPLRHNGSGMSLDEVDELSQRIDLGALRGYSGAVRDRTREVVKGLDLASLDEVMQEDRLRQILFVEGLAHPNSASLLENYTGWSKGRCWMAFGLTHLYQHFGEIEVIAALLGLDMG